MKRIAVLFLCFTFVGCGYLHNPFKTPSSLVSPAAKTAYTANEIVKRIGEFQTLVINLSDKNIIPLGDAREIVYWTTASLKTIKAYPDGWQMTVKTGYKTIRPKIADLPAIASWVPIIDGLIGFIVS